MSEPVYDLAAVIAQTKERAGQASDAASRQQYEQLAAWLVELQEAKVLLPLYRQLVGAIAVAPDARTALQSMRCWWGKENKLRIAMDLPEHEGRAFLGR